MTGNYEFTYQSSKQKLVLLGCKGLVLLLMVSSLHTIGWADWADLQDKLTSVGTVFGTIWMYANLAEVKVEVQELFVPSGQVYKCTEFLFIGLAFHIGDIGWTIYQIYLLS